MESKLELQDRWVQVELESLGSKVGRSISNLKNIDYFAYEQNGHKAFARVVYKGAMINVEGKPATTLWKLWKDYMADHLYFIDEEAEPSNIETATEASLQGLHLN